ncbi:PKD domain-containing protein [Neolewinella antarctica]|uniref:PKD repeat protein n=1 Tax=Neolewinella antarctica TaxID=442734 RepID=A0ABX0XHA7_9BACT|nr:PKD domain-containing protein [Neolewinella antarctica]NJC28229.1 PKD repeat protein [Neolewinella antarctica]
MQQTFTYYSFFLFILIFLPIVTQAQVTFDFETPETSTPIDANQGAIVDNPDRVGNDSDKCAYYRKSAGDWDYFAFPFANGFDIGNNDRVSFKVRTSTSGRIYIKFYDEGTPTLESWVVEYDYRPEPDAWTELSYNISALKDQKITRLEIAVSVNNEAAADAYFDDLRFHNSLSVDGEPVIDLAQFSNCVELGTTLDLDASASTDANGSITTFRWDMGDGTVIENMDRISHRYQAPGFYNVQLAATDNDDNTTTEKFRIWVFESEDNLSPFFATADTYLTNEKVELSFLTKRVYQNPFDPSEVSINAIVTQPDGTTRKVPCFFHEKVLNENGSWMTFTGDKNWMVRWSGDQAGVHQVQLEITDATGQNLGKVQEVNLLAGPTKGIIKKSDTNRQFYQHGTGEMYFPLGINLPWDNINDYATIIPNLSDGEANWIRYWHAAFTNQAIEWRDGLGNYSAVAGAKQDSIIELCKENEVSLQMVIFHHGMFSTTVNSNWSNSPYNVANGGMLVDPEEFFYNQEAKIYAKRLLRYIVARWGYSPEVFAWELFNEVQWTGRHPNQSEKWEEEVILWHDEMGQYLKEIDPFDHLVTTSAEDHQLDSLAGKEGIDIIQYHTYPAQRLNNELLSKDARFLEDNPETSVICGEYGYANDGEVPFDEQRLAIWSSIFSQVPHLTWRWELYAQTVWADLFTAPATFLREEEILQQNEWLDWNVLVESNTPGLRTTGFTQSNQTSYGLIYDEDFSDDIADATINLANLPFGVYTLETTDITSGEQSTEENLEITFFTTAYELPFFSDALVIKAAFKEELQILLAFAGFDVETGLGYALNLDGGKSIQPSNAAVDYEWSLAEQPVTSQLVIADADNSVVNIIPDVAGEYRFVFTLTDSVTQEVSTDTVNVLVSAPPVAVAGEDITVDLGARPAINGRSSFDPEGDRLAYAWTLVSKPEGSVAEVEFPTLSLPILDPDVRGTYALELVVSDKFNPSAPDTVLIKVGTTTSIAAIDAATSIRLFPNPSSEVLNVEFTGSITQRAVGLTILDITGRVVATHKADLGGQKVIPFPLSPLNLTNGMYILRVVADGSASSLPFVVQAE